MSKISWDFRFDARRPEPYEIVNISYEPDVRLAVVGFNSCVYETEQHHYGFIGGRQLTIVKELLDEKKVPRDVIRVAVIHHHLHPFPEPVETRNETPIWMDLSTIRDAGHVERYLERLGFDLLLHGHKHQAQIRETIVRDSTAGIGDVRPLIVCGAGSVGVSSMELPHSVSNHYQIIELLRISRSAGTHFLKLEWRELAVSTGAEWTTPKTWTIPG